MIREHRRVEPCCGKRSVGLDPDDSRYRSVVQSDCSRFPDALDALDASDALDALEANRSRHLARRPHLYPHFRTR